MSFSLRLCLLAGTLLPTALLSAQSPAARSEATLGVLVVGKPDEASSIALGSNDFEVLEDGRPIDVLKLAVPGSDTTPKRVVIVVDDVNIGLRNLSDEHLQVARFLRENGGKLAVPSRLAVFTSRGMQMSHGHTTDGNALAKGLDDFGTTLRSFDGDGIFSEFERTSKSIAGLQQLIASQATHETETAILWVSPGWPLLQQGDMLLSQQAQSRLFEMIAGLSSQMLERRVTLYALNPVGSAQDVGKENEYEVFLRDVKDIHHASYGSLALQVISLQSGGRLLSSNDTDSLLTTAYDAVRNRYQLTFDLPPAGKAATFHALRVRVKNPSQRAIARTGFYVLPASALAAR